ncbi:MAG: VOC family protein [bacterium]|nr:VOC family protein [bacterium]
MMALNVYLHFDGNCREVFEFYRSVFGGDFDSFSTFDEMPDEMGISEEEKNGVLHVSYEIGGTALMGSDVPSAFGPPVEMGNNFAISYEAESREETERLFQRISEGGRITMPLGDTFWGAYFGACTDRFGINWMVSYQ